MSLFAKNIFGSEENPLEKAARGELFVPIGDEDDPPVARRILIVCCVIVAVLGTVVCIQQRHKQSITLPERNRAMIGYNIDNIVDAPATVLYRNVEFAYTITEDQGIITGCAYSAKVDLEALNEVIDALVKRYESPDEFDKQALSTLTEGELAALDTATWTWLYSGYSVKSLEELDGWGSKKNGSNAKLYMELTVTADSDNMTDVLIRYGVRPYQKNG